MSGLPSAQGVRELRNLLKSQRRLSEEVERLREEVESKSRRMRVASTELNSVSMSIIKQLQNMDCAANGNCGWENRICWMLAELEQQAQTQGAEDS